jgi:universal stress protein E
MNGFITQEFESFLQTSQPDVIFKSNTEYKFLNGIFRSKTERYFVTDCRYPVWIVKPRIWDDEIEVLCCLDIDDKSEINHKLNVDILAVSEQLARLVDGQLHVIDCFFGEVCSMSFAVEESGHFIRTTSVQGQHHALIQSYISGFTLHEQSLHVVSGTPDFAIPDTASRLQAELVVIGNNADHGIMDRLFGDTAANLVNNMSCDVLVIKH